MLHLPGAVQGEGGGAAAAVHAHVPPQVRGQVAQDHLILPSLQARAQVMDADSTPADVLTAPAHQRGLHPKTA